MVYEASDMMDCRIIADNRIYSNAQNIFLNGAFWRDRYLKPCAETVDSRHDFELFRDPINDTAINTQYNGAVRRRERDWPLRHDSRY
jgi:hypothetical protein